LTTAIGLTPGGSVVVRLSMEDEPCMMNPGSTAYQESLCLSNGLLLISKFISDTK